MLAHNTITKGTIMRSLALSVLLLMGFSSVQASTIARKEVRRCNYAAVTCCAAVAVVAGGLMLCELSHCELDNTESYSYPQARVTVISHPRSYHDQYELNACANRALYYKREYGNRYDLEFALDQCLRQHRAR